MDQLTDLARRAKWGTPDWFVPYRQAESEAAVIRSWAPLIVPGLEQTEGYARAVLSAEPYTPDQLEELLRHGSNDSRCCSASTSYRSLTPAFCPGA